MAGGRAGWYARRLRTMGPREVAWRVGRLGVQLTHPYVEARRRHLPDDEGWWPEALAGFRQARDRPVLLDRDRARRIAAEAPAEAAELVAAAERVLEHRFTYFGYPPAQLGAVIDWHHDPVSEHHWPRVPARRIDHRTAPADPKWIWELNRLQHLPWLAQAWLMTDRDEFALEAFAQLDSWLHQHRIGEGIAWRGAFEVGVRAISVLVALGGLRDHPMLDAGRFRRLVEVADAGARACWRERSLHSSANNHLVGELAGLVTTSLMLPELPGSERRLRRGLAALAVEAERQILPDGAGAEQAVGYQMFTAELLLVVDLLTGLAGRAAPPAIGDALRRDGDYLAALVAPGDPEPRYGDDDEGFALRLGPEPLRTVADHLSLLRAYGAPTAAADAPLAARWVQAATARPGVRRLLGEADASPRSTDAPDGGLVVLRRERERWTVDVGPLGYLGIAAHGHADALAVTWSLEGHDVVVDPGTGSYYGHPAWRRAHRGTRMHATVAVDDEDSSVMAGPFLWAERATATRHRVDPTAGVVDAEHDGYDRLADPVRHRRRVLVTPGEHGAVVVDIATGAGAAPHRVRTSWPLAPDLDVREVDGAAGAGAVGHLLLREGRPVAQLVTAATVPLRHERVRGDEATHLGWSSARLEQRTPAWLLSAVAQTPAAQTPAAQTPAARPALDGALLVVVTVLRPVGPDGLPPVTGLRVDPGGGPGPAYGATARWQEGGEPRSLDLGVALTTPAW